MPRSHDGPIPQRPERNEMSGRMDDIFGQFGPGRANDGQGQGAGPRLNDYLADRGADRPDRPVRPDREFDGDTSEGGFGATPRQDLQDSARPLDVSDWFFG